MTRATPRSTLERRLGHRFRRPELLAQALTHRSASHESGGVKLSNEVLEFLGDAVLGLLIADRLYDRAGESGEGEMSRLRAVLVSRQTLAEVGRELGLPPRLVLGRGEESGGGRDKPSILADACEAIIGALYVDGGLAAAKPLITRLFAPRLEVLLGGPSPADPKSALQERLQEGGGSLPRYRVLAEEGPSHDRRFRVEVRSGRRLLGRGEGRSHREAEREAALRALARLDGEGVP